MGKGSAWSSFPWRGDRCAVTRAQAIGASGPQVGAGEPAAPSRDTARVPMVATCPQQWLWGHLGDSEAQRAAGSPHMCSFLPGGATREETLLRAAEAPRTTGNLSFLRDRQYVGTRCHLKLKTYGYVT